MTAGEFFGNATVSAVVGGLTAWLATYRMQRSFLLHAAEDTISELFAELRAESSVYWRKRGKDEVLEGVIIKLNMRCRDRLIRHDRKFLKSKNAIAIKLHTSQLHNALTDGTFATVERVPDLARIARIENCIEKLKRLVNA